MPTNIGTKFYCWQLSKLYWTIDKKKHVFMKKLFGKQISDEA